MACALDDQQAADPSRRTNDDKHGSLAQALLNELLATSVVLSEDWETLAPPKREDLAGCTDTQAMLDKLVEHGLLTPYQARRVGAGKAFGLVLGNYRVLDRLGDGGMGVVFLAEHVRMRRPVAVKVLALSPHEGVRNLSRFVAEMRAVGRLQHPNVVAAMDCGDVVSPEPDAPVLHYFVMEYVSGQDLEAYVEGHGPLPPARACELIYQIASALDEAHKHHLVHRDIKPSNIQLTPEGQVKVLDFGLALHFCSRRTEPGTLLGTVDYMAPEQARDASAVDIRADIYALGGVLFWCLTGCKPFPTKGNAAQAMVPRLTQPPPSVRVRRPEVPAELDAIVARMMAVHPDDRYPEPRAVMRALQAFIQSSALDDRGSKIADLVGCSTLDPRPCDRVRRVLIVDDEPHIRCLCRYALQSDDLHCEEAANGVLALQAFHARRYDLALLDIDMPEMKGPEVLRRLRQAPPGPHFKVIMFSGRSSADEMAQMLLAGADDYLTKPFSNVQLQARVKAALRLKEAQEQSDSLNRQLLSLNCEQGQTLTARESDLLHTRNALMLALCKLVEYRRNETGEHLLRLQRFSRALAEEAASLPEFAGQIDTAFIQTLERCAPLHDVGTVALPDHILLKPGRLDAAERLIMQSHTTIGAEILQTVARQHGPALAFLQMAIDIARHHHERHDGTGYPDRLAGRDIPLPARLVSVADVYDSLRSGRTYRVALSHACAVQVIVEESAGQFDPTLLQVFQRCAPRLERIFRELAS